MNTFILTWSPLGDFSDEEYEELVDDFQFGEIDPEFTWSTGNRTNLITPGDRFFFLRQRIDRGIVASGTFVSEVASSGRGRFPNGARIEFDEVRPVADRLPIEILRAEVPEYRWDNLYTSGRQIPNPSAKRVEKLWSSSPASIELDYTDSPRTEGPSGKKLVNDYDRDPVARRECLRHWGYRCQVCDFDFERTYGERGRRFIHVHHLHDLSLSKRRRTVDPKKDLRPVCANCHAMLHTERPALAIDELKKELRRARRKSR